jgi:hypothetical protein
MLEKGDLVVDTMRQVMGEIMDFSDQPGRGQLVILRPPRGGREWAVPVGYCRQVQPNEMVSIETLRHRYRES